MDKIGTVRESPVKGESCRRWGHGALVLATIFFLVACAGGGGPASNPGKGDRLDILTNFTLALSKRDFPSATDMLAPAERSLFLDGSGKVLPEFQERLRAMRLTTLVNNPAILVEQGRIRGIFDVMPVIDQAAPMDSPSAAETAPMDSLSASETAPSLDNPVGIPSDDAEPAVDGRHGLRAATETFFRSVRQRNWNRALGMVNPRERAVFLKSDGMIKETAKRRLSSMDTASWEALMVEEGKLSGVILIIPD